jgi:hypothetical protein
MVTWVSLPGHSPHLSTAAGGTSAGGIAQATVSESQEALAT